MSFVTNAPKKSVERISARRMERVLLTCVVALAGMMFWIAPRPAMVDLPQHVAQVEMWRHLLAGTSPWSDLVRTNYFTPYLLGYGLALVFTCCMPVLAAFKLVLTLTYFGYVWAGIKLREEFNSDPRLDWLFIPGFFGFAYQWGFYGYLVATPVAFVFVLFAHRFAQSPSPARGIILTLAGIGLFFSHGLAFLFACAVGAVFIPIFCKTPRQFVAALAPYFLLGLLTLAYYFALHHNNLLVPKGAGGATGGMAWDWTSLGGWHRSFTFLLFAVATSKQDWYFLVGVGLLLAAPWLIGARLNTKHPSAFVMFAFVVAIWFGAPSDALGTSALYQRFAIYLLPAYALLFCDVMPVQATVSSRRQHQGGGVTLVVRSAVALFCLTYLCVLGVRTYRFAADSAPFELVLEAAEPGQRALGVVLDPESSDVHNPYTYVHFPLWYEVDKDGFVDFNFAIYLPEIVRFKSDRVPPDARLNGDLKFDWHAVQGQAYRYFFVHHSHPLPAGMFDNDECQVVQVKEAGEWALFERKTCK